MPRPTRGGVLYVVQCAVVLAALFFAIIIFTRPSQADDPPPCVSFNEALTFLSENPHITGYVVARNGVIFARVRNGPVVVSVPEKGTGCMTRPAPIPVPPAFIDAHPELKAGEGA